MNNFADKLIEQIKSKNSCVVCGLDPDWNKIPECIKSKYKSKGAAIFAFNKAIIDSVYDLIPAVKPQLAYYEQYGVNGIISFKATVDYARQKGLLVIADGKRNDIGSTSEAYAKAYLSEGDKTIEEGPLKEGAFECDALTVNPYLGEDGVKPFIQKCNENGTGIFILVKTSNPSSDQLQNLKLEDGNTVYEKVAVLVDMWGKESVGKYGYSSVGAVVGATYPEEAEKIRKLIPRAIILVPGYGAQGGDALSVSVNFNNDGLGAVVNSSRNILYAYKSEKWSAKYDDNSFADASRAEVINMNYEISKALRGKNG